MPLPASVHWILFDAVGTLIHPARPVAETYHAVAQRFGLELSVAEIGQRFAGALAREFGPSAGLTRPPTNEAGERARWQRIVAAVLPELPAAAGEPFEQLWHYYAQPSSWRLYDDVPPTLAELARRGYQLAIASNFDSRLHGIAAASPPLTACWHVFVSSDLGYSKPDPRFFGAAEVAAGATAEEVLLVGDDLENDYRGAQSAGWQAALIDRAGRENSVPVIRSLTELLS